MEKEKKVCAAIAGVMSFLKSENQQSPVTPDVTIMCPQPWALQGRQQIIQMRTLMQRRVLKR